MQDFLTKYLQFHSVSLAEENEIPETAEFLRTQFTKLGATTSRILHTDRTNPAVYAVFRRRQQMPPQSCSTIITMFNQLNR